MSQEFTITWVGERTREWSSSRGGTFIDYAVALAEYDPTDHGAKRKTVVLTQKPDTPAPQVGQKIFGGIQVEEKKARDGSTFTVHKLKKEQRPDGPRRLSTNGAAQASKDDGFWAQKDRRISRAGIMQSVVASGKYNDLTGQEYVAKVNAATDALLASLDDKVPSPNDLPSAQEVEQVAEQQGLEVEVPEPGRGFADPEDIPF